MNYTSWVRIVCISDTHTLHRQVTVPDGDVLIHAGDICNHGTRGEVKQFVSWLGELPHRHKIFIAGNHDWPFDKHGRHAHHWIKHGTYLQDTAIMIEGLKFYGSPWQPEFCNWAFNLPRGKRLEFVWSSIPDDTDVLITHTPPLFVFMSHLVTIIMRQPARHTQSQRDREGTSHETIPTKIVPTSSIWV